MLKTVAFRYLSRRNFKITNFYRLYSSEAVFPGAPNAEYTNSLNFIKGNEKPFPIFRIIDSQGNVVNKEKMEIVKKTLTNEKLVHMYKQIILLNVMDDILYNAQRQGRISFYMTNYGEECLQIGSTEALQPDDEIFAQYREAGVLLYRGFTLDEIMAQNFSTKNDLGKGRQMPVHYGSKKLHFQTISSPLATQIPQSVGAGYALKREGTNRICVCYFGEGAASEGDFHAALNFAATLKTPTIFICRNNGYAISTPTKDQYAGDGIAGRGIGYGIHTVRVDGNDLFSVYLATKEAREIAKQNQPVLIEAMTYRAGHHSTSDDATRYRSEEEIKYWKELHNPIIRLMKYLIKNNLWDEKKEEQHREDCKQKVMKSLLKAEQDEKVPVSELFTDVYDEIPNHLLEQKEKLEKHLYN